MRSFLSDLHNISYQIVREQNNKAQLNLSDDQDEPTL